MACPGKDGGWNAERVFELPNCQQDTIFEDRQIFHLAQSDLCGIAFHLHRAKLRKATPPWAAPAEVWRQLFFPQYHQSQLRCGISYRAFSAALCYLKLGCNGLLYQFVGGSGLQTNGSTVCLFNWTNRTTTPVVRAFVWSAVWTLAVLLTTSTYGDGAVLAATDPMLPDIAGKSLAWNRYANKMSYHTGCEAGKFHTQDLFSTFKMLSPANLQLQFQVRWILSLDLKIGNCGSSGTGKLWFVSAMGVQKLTFALLLAPCKAMGHQQNFFWNPTTCSWTSGRKQLQLMSRENFWWPSAFFFLVRLSRTFLCLLLLMMLAESAWEQRLKTCASRLKLPTLVWIDICGISIWFRMWTSRNMLFSLVERTVLNTSGLYTVLLLPGRTAPSARYLGAQVHYSGKLHTEIDKRLQIAKRNWAKMGPFSFRSFSSKHGKILVYVALVHSALLSGLESQVLDAGKYQQLNSLVLKHGRKLMQGKACSKQVMPDGTSRIFHARPKPFGAGWACVLWISSCRLGGLFGISSWLKTFRIIFAFSWPFLAGSGVKLATQLTQPAGFCRLPIPGLSSSWLIFNVFKRLMRVKHCLIFWMIACFWFSLSFCLNFLQLICPSCGEHLTPSAFHHRDGARQKAQLLLWNWTHLKVIWYLFVIVAWPTVLHVGKLFRHCRHWKLAGPKHHGSEVRIGPAAGSP